MYPWRVRLIEIELHGKASIGLVEWKEASRKKKCQFSTLLVDVNTAHRILQYALPPFSRFPW